MVELQEILTALEDERALCFIPLRFRVDRSERRDDIYQLNVEPEDDRSFLDETIEGFLARWDNPGPGFANVLSVIPEDGILNLRFISGPPPSAGGTISVQMLDFLGSLLSLWRDETIAQRAFDWLADLSTREGNDLYDEPISDSFPLLRARQKEAFRLCRFPQAFLWGPPGTGKTTTVGCILASYLTQFPRDKVLLLATTNTAVDQALVAVDKGLDEISKTGTDVELSRKQCQRIGLYFIPSHYEGREYLLPADDPAIIKELARLEYERPDPREHVKYAKWRDAVDTLRGELRSHSWDALYETRLHAMTTTQAMIDFGILQGLEYDIVIVDEASQVGLAHAMPLGLLGKRVIFAGDHKQLAPIVQSDLPAADKWLRRSPFHYMKQGYQSTCILNEQNRMAEPICNLVSHLFYNGRLKVATDASSDKEWQQARKLNDISQMGCSAIYIHTVHQEGTFARPGWYRLNSRDFICQTIKRLATLQRQEDILVLTPFRAQRYRIKRQLTEIGLERVSVTTVHRAQGSERHTVVFDPVRGGCKWIMSEEGERLITVALSRAKARLIITLSRGDLQNPILYMIPALVGYGTS